MKKKIFEKPNKKGITLNMINRGSCLISSSLDYEIHRWHDGSTLRQHIATFHEKKKHVRLFLFTCKYAVCVECLLAVPALDILAMFGP